MAKDEYQAAEYAGELYDLNVSRKELTEQGVRQAKELVEQMGEDHLEILKRVAAIAADEKSTDRLVDSAAAEELYQKLNGLM